MHFDMTLSASFIQSILEKSNIPDIIGVGFDGSYSRREQSKYGGVALDIYASQMPENKEAGYA